MNDQLKLELTNVINKENNIIAFYDYGSSVYKTTNEKSDHDIIMIVDNKENYIVPEKLNIYFDINMFDKKEFEQLIKNHEITALECIFLPKENVWKESIKWDFTLHLPTLRNACSSKSSNSWVKAKKKFIIEKDFNEYIGKKSAWHAIRILNFGFQLGEKGHIYDYKKVNLLLPQIMSCSSWEEIDSKFRKTYNEASSLFKSVAPKDLENKKAKP